ncbi:MAG: hypothetical protein WKH64_08620 [Chloroflexia bacterium]
MNAAYRRLPASTEQILHPEKYDARTNPSLSASPTWRPRSARLEEGDREHNGRVPDEGAASRAAIARTADGGDRRRRLGRRQVRDVDERPGRGDSLALGVGQRERRVGVRRSSAVLRRGKVESDLQRARGGATVTTGEWSARILQSGANTTCM